MARSVGVAGTLISGKTGALTWQVREGEQIVFESPVFDKKKERTEAQADYWARFAVVTSSAKAFEPQLKMSFEKQKRTDNFAAEFMKFNIKRSRVYLTRQQVESGMQVLDNFVVSHGPLGDDYVVKCGRKDDMIVSNICLGDLVIDEETTVQEFSAAVITNNRGLFREHHRITFVRAFQEPAVDIYPAHIRVVTYKLTLNQTDPEGLQTKLSAVVGPDSFVSTPAEDRAGRQRQYLSAPIVAESMLCWIHSFDLDGAHTVCSDQSLIGVTSMLERFLTAKAKSDAIESYRVNTVNNLSPNSADSDAQAEGSALRIDALGQLPTVTTPGGSTGGTQPGGGSGTGTGSDPTYTISFRIEPDASWGSVTMVPAQMPVPRGTQVRLTAAPNTSGGKRFGHWSNGSTDLTITVTADSDRTLTATFENITAGGGGGNVNPGEDFGSRQGKEE